MFPSPCHIPQALFRDLSYDMTSSSPSSSPTNHDDDAGYIVINTHSSRGHILRTTRYIPAGSIIFTEEPLFILDDNDIVLPHHIQQLCYKYHIPQHMIIRGIILSQYHHWDKHELLESLYHSQPSPTFISLCYEINLEAIGITLDVETFMKLTCVYDINNMIIQDGKTALYPMLSRLSHSCKPNAVATLTSTSTSTSSSPSSSTYIRTLRTLISLQPNEEITISYLSPQELMRSAAWRNQKLQQQWKFVCDCIRCTSVDMTRVLRCPTCQQHVFVKGKIETSTFHTIISHTTCTCTKTSSYLSSLLTSETTAEKALTSLTSQLPSPHVPHLQLITSALKTCLECVTTQHWIYMELLIILRDWYDTCHETIYANNQQHAIVEWMECALVETGDIFHPMLELADAWTNEAMRIYTTKTRRSYIQLLLERAHHVYTVMMGDDIPSGTLAHDCERIWNEVHHLCALSTCTKTHSSHRCSRCKCTYYCSRECQAQHWKREHKKECIPYVAVEPS